MAIDFGLDNGDADQRYLRLPVRSEWNMDGTSYTAISKVLITNANGGWFGYWHSTGTVNTANSFSMWHGENGRGGDRDKFSVGFSDESFLSAGQAEGLDIDDGQWRLVIARPSAGSVFHELAWIAIDTNTITAANEGTAVGGSTNPALADNIVQFGMRNDINNARAYKNVLAWHGQWNIRLSDADIIAMANGQTPFETQNANLQVLADMTSIANVTELLSGDTATVFGTGIVDVPQPYPVQPPPGVGYETHTVI